jgi:hypothetical protein
MGHRKSPFMEACLMRRVFIGFDPNETVALHVLAHSIMRHSSIPVQITPMVLWQLPMTRPPDPMQSTEFSFSRFLVPHLCGYEGTAAFLDCDMLCRTDIAELFAEAHPDRAVSVVQHDYTPKHATKFLDKPQTAYRRKNWSSVMVFQNSRCRALTPGSVNTASGLELHQFKWLQDSEIGALDPAWNHLVGEYDPNPAAKLVHFTLGTPCFAKYADCEFAAAWHEERRLMLHHNPIGEFSLAERVAA